MHTVMTRLGYIDYDDTIITQVKQLHSQNN